MFLRTNILKKKQMKLFIKLFLIAFFTIIPVVAFAERYAIIGLDDVVVTVIESDTYPSEAVAPAGGYIIIATPESGAETGGSYKNGLFSPRPKSPQELLIEKMNSAIDTNKTFLAIQSPTQEQTSDQVKKLTQQITAILQYQLQRFDGVSQ